jgi:dihydrofolate synthase/folylpolyglutamate synthase
MASRTLNALAVAPLREINRKMNFEEAVEYLFGLGHEILTIKLGLRNTELLLASLENPERSFPSVQIAGTNGKGSTAVMLDSICLAAGMRTGLYTSPHLISITERIQIAGQQISEEGFARHTATVRDASRGLLESKQIEALPTFFEQVTAIALLAFREAGVDLAILETGLGGRLDSTTAARAGIVAITQIAMDHEQYLGQTIESIASEKAAIIRPGVTAIIGKQDPRALSMLLSRCKETGVHPILATPPSEPIRIGLRGRHQLENAAVAIHLAETLSISRDAILSGLETAHHPGRLELIDGEPPILLDGAHNPAGAEALRDYLEQFGRKPLTLVFGAMSDKKLGRIGEILFPLADNLILTTIDNPRAASVETLQPIATRFGPESVTKTKTVTDAFNTALRMTPNQGMICVTGSLYLIGEWKQIT